MMELMPLVIGDLKVKYPVVQGGMGVGISLSSLAGAVAKAGGMGIISTAQIGFREADFEENSMEANLRAMEKELQSARNIAPDGCIGFNIMVATKGYEKYVRRAVEIGADIIISGAGLPTDLPKYVQDCSTKIAPIVSSAKSAKVICKLWDRHYKTAPDMVVIEGPKAGGHLGFSLSQLKTITEAEYEGEILQILKEVKGYEVKYNKRIPVIVAGGIYDYEDVKRQMELGADGVQVATRFVTTYECDAPMAFKEAYINSRKEDIVIVKSPVGMPGRAIFNGFLDQVARGKKELGRCYQCLERCDQAKIPYCITEALVNAANGDVDQALLFCGENAYRAEKLELVEDVMMELTGQKMGSRETGYSNE